MRKKILYVMLAISIWPLITICEGQPSTEWMSPTRRGFLKSMKLEYNKPENFNEVLGMECFKDYPDLERIITCAGNQLHSVDGEFVVFIPIYRRYNEEDSLLFVKMFKTFKGGDRMHEAPIKLSIEKSLGKVAAEKWWDHVKYYSASDALTKFNADSAIHVKINLTPIDYYKSKYTNFDALFLTKKNRGYINFFCFYTDKAKENLAMYWKSIESVFRYQD